MPNTAIEKTAIEKLGVQALDSMIEGLQHLLAGEDLAQDVRAELQKRLDLAEADWKRREEEGPTDTTKLGVFFWYSLPGEMMSLEQVRRVWRQHGLDVGLLPKSRKPADVAAEACSIIDRSSTAPSFTQIENSKEHLLYRAESLTGETEVRFVKGTGEFVCLDEELLRRVRIIYERNGTRLPPHKQRRALTDYMLAGGAENLHGSIYFMPALGQENGTAIDRVGRAEAMVKALYGESAEFHAIPVEADGLQLEYVGRSIYRVLTDEIMALTREVAEMLEKDPHRKWRSDRIESISRRKAHIDTRIDRFVLLLGNPPPETVIGAAAAMTQLILDLLRQVEVPEIT